jgi:hypothetical protein
MLLPLTYILLVYNLKISVMKKALFISMLITVGILICNCSNNSSNRNSKITANTNTNTASNINNGSANGTYKGSGTISFTAGGVNYSCSISKVIAASTSLTIQTSTADVRTNGSIVITCYTATSAIVTGTYTASSSTNISSVSFIDKTVTPFLATSITSGSSCTVNITSLTSTTIKGTFTATVLKPIDSSKLIITDGVINCTIISK